MYHHVAAHKLHACQRYGVRGASVAHLSVPQGDEADAGAQTARPHQSLPGRAEGPDGDRFAGRGRERGEVGEGGHPRAHGTSSSHVTRRQEAHPHSGEQLRRSLPRRFHPVRPGSVDLPVDAGRRGGASRRRCPADATSRRLSSTTRGSGRRQARARNDGDIGDEDDPGQPDERAPERIHASSESCQCRELLRGILRVLQRSLETLVMWPAVMKASRDIRNGRSRRAILAMKSLPPADDDAAKEENNETLSSKH